MCDSDNYIKIHNLEIGDILSINYCDFDNKERLGLFVVIYTNEKEEDKHRLNFLGCKITSCFKDEYKYYVELPKGMANLRKDSRICSNLVHILHKKQIRKHVGRLPKEKLIELRDMFSVFTDIVDKQMEGVIQ